jgi:hypothetical protein
MSLHLRYILALALLVLPVSAAQSGPALSGLNIRSAPIMRSTIPNLASRSITVTTIKSVNRGTLGTNIRALDGAAETARASRNEIKTQFSGMDQASNREIQMLTQVVKTTAEIRNISASSRSGF